MTDNVNKFKAGIGAIGGNRGAGYERGIFNVMREFAARNVDISSGIVDGIANEQNEK